MEITETGDVAQPVADQRDHVTDPELPEIAVFANQSSKAIEILFHMNAPIMRHGFCLSVNAHEVNGSHTQSPRMSGF